jgi:hypothetical protein
MDMLEHIKDILKVLGAILTLSATPEGIAKGVVITAVLLIAALVWKLLQEFRGWRKEQTELATTVKRLTISTDFLVEKHCKLHDTDTLELLQLQQSQLLKPANATK